MSRNLLLSDRRQHQMHLRLLASLILIGNTLMFSCAVEKQSVSAGRELRQDCRSCLECSRENGCIRCPDRLFLFLRRDGMTHHGSCLHACPLGHFGLRGKDANRCMKCRASECERCFNKDFCTKCKGGFLLYKGKCFGSCPEGTFPHAADCIEGCTLSPVGGWGEWSPCQSNGRICGVRVGRQSRIRMLAWQAPENRAALCPPQRESRRCRMKKRCPKERRKNGKRGGRKRGKKQRQLQNNRTVTEPPDPPERPAQPGPESKPT